MKLTAARPWDLSGIAGVDLVALIGGDLHQVGHRAEWVGGCPFCRDGEDRFHVWPDADLPRRDRGRWWCRVCDRAGDALDFLRQAEGLDLDAACERLGLSREGGPARPLPATARPAAQPARRTRSVHDDPPPAAWQERARLFVARAQAVLRSADGAAALGYLRDDRGLTDDTIDRWRLGYVPRDVFDRPEAWGLDGGKKVWLPRGILIPCDVGGALYYLTVRRPSVGPDGEPDQLARRLGVAPADDGRKYVRPRGHTAALFGADTLGGAAVALDLEGELDVIVTHQEAGDLAAAVTMGGTDTPLGGRWLLALARVPRIVAVRDNDDAGAAAAAQLAALSKRLRVASYPPGVKDAAALHGGGGDLRGWVAAVLGTADDTGDVFDGQGHSPSSPDADGMGFADYLADQATADVDDVLDPLAVAQARYFAVQYERAGALIAGDADRLADLEPVYADAKAAWFAALDERSRICFPEENE